MVLNMSMMYKKTKIFIHLISIVISITSCTTQDVIETYTILNNNIPQFAKNEIQPLNLKIIAN